MKLIRVFPRRTKATPDDDLVYTSEPDMFAEADEIHVSVAFTWDIPRAERLAKAWERVAPVNVGGPAYKMRGEEFVPGKYLRIGNTITSRGCPLRCWFCSVWKRDGTVRELPIRDGWIVQDDNLLGCSEPHIRAVFDMLRRQPHRVEFRGGIEPSMLADWHIDLMTTLKPRPVIWCAYDTPNDLEPLRDAGKRLLAAGFTVASHRLRCYVLIGHPKDTMDAAETRLRQAIATGFTPFAMLWKPDTATTMKHTPGDEWRAFQRRWARPAIMYAKETP